MSLEVNANQQVRFERGFKSWCENTALATRSRLNLSRVDPLPPISLAAYLTVRVWTPIEVPGLSSETNDYLTSPEGDEWSAVTVRVGRKDVVVLNPTHSPARQASDLMHELAHIIRNHEPAQIFIMKDQGFGLRSFNELQEAEANWFAGCLLLPREALVYSLSHRMTKDAISLHYGVSLELVRYRINVTGASRNFSA